MPLALVALGPQTDLSSRPERSEVEGPAVFILLAPLPCQHTGPQTNLSSRPKRTRISCHAALERTTCAPSRKEMRMKSTEATKSHRKSGGAQGTCCSPKTYNRSS